MARQYCRMAADPNYLWQSPSEKKILMPCVHFFNEMGELIPKFIYKEIGKMYFFLTNEKEMHGERIDIYFAFYIDDELIKNTPESEFRAVMLARLKEGLIEMGSKYDWDKAHIDYLFKEIDVNIEQTLSLRLMNFWREMYEWESTAYNEYQKDKNLFDDEKWQEKQTAIRTKIYEEYITQKERKNGGAEFSSVGFPPKYNPENETIASIALDKKKASVFTHRLEGARCIKMEYKFKMVGDKWRIDVIKKYHETLDKWRDITIL